MTDYYKLLHQFVEIYDDWETVDDMLLDIIIETMGSNEYDECKGEKRVELLFLYKQLRNVIKAIYHLRNAQAI